MGYLTFNIVLFKKICPQLQITKSTFEYVGNSECIFKSGVSLSSIRPEKTELETQINIMEIVCNITPIILHTALQVRTT